MIRSLRYTAPRAAALSQTAIKIRGGSMICRRCAVASWRRAMSAARRRSQRRRALMLAKMLRLVRQPARAGAAAAAPIRRVCVVYARAQRAPDAARRHVRHAFATRAMPPLPMPRAALCAIRSLPPAFYGVLPAFD